MQDVGACQHRLIGQIEMHFELALVGGRQHFGFKLHNKRASRIGGFGSAVSEWRSFTNCAAQQISLGTDDEFMHEVGSQNYARKKYGLTAEHIAARVAASYKE